MTRLSATERLKYAAKLVVAWLLYLLGVLHLWKRVALRRRAIVLVYHRVVGPEDAKRVWSHPGIVVTRRTFERHMAILARWFRPLSAWEFVSILERGTEFPPGSCLVTFDDGWEDTYREAWPLLRQYRVPALVFLPAGLIGTPETFWQERMGHLLYAASRRARRDPGFAVVARRALEPVHLDPSWRGADDAVRRSILTLVQAQKRKSQDAEAAIPVLADLLEDEAADPGCDRLMNWHQVREMACAGIVFGSHGATHRILTSLSPDSVEDEVRQSQQVMERELGAQPAAFSYPNGDLDESVTTALRKAGFRLAFSMKRGPVDQRHDPLAVPRINIHEDVTGNTPLFLARILGVF